MSETHIAHAVATFSELGIAAGLVWLIDAVPLRTDLAAQLVVANESQRVTQAAYKAKANEFDWTLGLVIHSFLFLREKSFTCLIVILLQLLHRSPFICIGLGVYALFGISFYPSAPDFLPSFFSFNRSSLDIVYFIMAALSFMVVCTPIVAMVAKQLINWYALKDIKIE